MLSVPALLLGMALLHDLSGWRVQTPWWLTLGLLYAPGCAMLSRMKAPTSIALVNMAAFVTLNLLLLPVYLRIVMQWVYP